MLHLRSAVFNALFYAHLILWLIACVPTLAMPRRVFMRMAVYLAHASLWLLRVVVGTRVEWRGIEHVRPGPAIVACKHQSIWETFALFALIPDPAFILKRELMWIPLFGWCVWKSDSVPINRGGGAPVLQAMIKSARHTLAQGRPIIIFPEGTSRAAGAPPAYKFGVAALYEALGAPCLPIALNSGVYWPRRSFLIRPGTVVVEVLPPIPPGMERAAFFEEIQRRIETASDRLLAEGRREIGAV